MSPAAPPPGTLGVQPINVFLKAAGITHAAAAAPLGRSEARISRIANGQSRPSPDLAAGLAPVKHPVETCFSEAMFGVDALRPKRRQASRS